MFQKFVIALLALVLAALGGAWAHSAWIATAGSPAAVPSPPPSVPQPPADQAGPAFTYEYVPPRNPALLAPYERVREQDLLRQLPEVKALDGLFLLPRPLRLVTAECRDADAFYSPATAEVVLCYEMIQSVLNQGETVAVASGLGDEFPPQYLSANLRFMLLHEIGHALIGQLQLPITGREEDAVDQLATMLMQKFASADESAQQVAENLRMAGNWFLARSQAGQYNLDAYADEHALGEQRYFNLQCLIYGSDPARFLGIVTSGDLPEARARRCPEEWERVNRSWLKLLLPHVAPKFQMTEEKAAEFFEEKERAREAQVESLYVR